MKKILLSIVFVLVVIPFFSSCENESVNEEIGEIEINRFSTDKGDVSGPGSGDDDDDERS